MRIALQQTEKLGDTILTLPMAALIKAHFPEAIVILIGLEPARSIAALSLDINEFYATSRAEEAGPTEIANLKALKLDAIIHVSTGKQPILKWAKEIGIPIRIGTWNRLHHLFTCNRHVYIKRKRVQRNEALLNLKLLKPLNIPYQYNLEELYQKMSLAPFLPLNDKIKALLDPKRFNIIIHPGSSATGINNREWPETRFVELIALLDPTRFNILITGGIGVEYERCKKVAHHPAVHNLMGSLTMPELFQLIQHADGLLSCPTAPLHLAGLFNKRCLGLYLPHPSKNSLRWGPFGSNSEIITATKCAHCQTTMKPTEDQCTCMQNLDPKRVVEKILAWPKVTSDCYTKNH